MGVEMELIRALKCEDRRVYRMRGRNLGVAVFAASANSFIGIRRKFGSAFLDVEYHVDCPHGTAVPVERLDKVVPDDIPLVCNMPPRCKNCGEAVY